MNWIYEAGPIRKQVRFCRRRRTTERRQGTKAYKRASCPDADLLRARMTREKDKRLRRVELEGGLLG